VATTSANHCSGAPRLRAPPWGPGHVRLAADRSALESPGLETAEAGTHGRASVKVVGTKLAALEGTKQAAVETVFELLEVDWDWAYISHIGEDPADTRRLSLEAASTSRLRFHWRAWNMLGQWAAPLATMGRTVVHVVLDTDVANEDDKVKLYLNGARVTRSGGTPPDQFDVLDLVYESNFVLGNREAGHRSFRGTLFYSALYGAALTEEEVLHNTGAIRQHNLHFSRRVLVANQAPPPA